MADLRKLTVTFEDGSQISRTTGAPYTHVASNGFHATWHTRRDLAEKSARSNGWKVYEVDQAVDAAERSKPRKAEFEHWKERYYAGVLIEGVNAYGQVKYKAAAFGVRMQATTVEELMARIDRKLEERA